MYRAAAYLPQPFAFNISTTFQLYFKYENGRIITDFTKRANTDQSMKGIKKIYKESPQKAEKLADEIIKNTYRTLMTRGMKGCYIYCVDKKLREYLKEQIKVRKNG